MSEVDDLRGELASMRARNEHLSRSLVEAEQAVGALTRGEIDAVVGPSQHPILLEAAQMQLRRSERLLRAVFDGALDALVLVDDDGAYVDANAAACALFGLPHALLLGRRTTEFSTFDDQSTTRFKKFLEAGRIEGQFPIRRADQTLRMVDCNGVANVGPGLHLFSLRDITERKTVERERDRFFHLSVDLLCIGGLDGRFRRLNPAWEATLGWSLDELGGRPWLDFVHPDDVAATIGAGTELGQGTTVVRFENRYRCKDGSYRRLRWTTIPSVEEGLVYATARDVTDERATAERERALFTVSPVPMWLLDSRSFRILEVNEAALAKYGYSRAEMLSLTLHDIVVKDQHVALAEHVASIVASGRGSVPMRKHRTKSGAILDVEVNSYRLDIGETPEILAVLIDVTHRREMEAELRASEQRYRRIVDNASEGIWMYDAAGTTTFVNPSMAAMLGGTVGEVIGQPASAFMGAPAQQEHGADDDGRDSSDGGRNETKLRRRDGSELWVSINTDALVDEHGYFESALALVTDITARRLSDDALHRSEQHLRQAQKMEAIGRLAGGVAHDFNNLLSVILGYADLSIDSLKAGDPLRRDLEEIQMAGRRASDLTRQLLTFSRQQVLAPRVLDLNRVLADMKAMLGRLLGEAIEITVVPSPTAATVLADPGQLEQVVMNLAVNARDAMPSGGKLHIEISSVRAYPSTPDKPGTTEAGTYVTLEVSDTGSGIDEPTLAKIFEPFFTTKAMGKGTGLGLATVFGIVEQSGGFIRVSSELGKGTSFRVHLPRTERLVDAATDTMPPASARRGSETILLVEDDDQVRAVASTILRRHGYHVLDSSNGGEAFLISDDFDGTIDLLLTDLVLPRLSGRKVAEQLTLKRPDMKVLFASGYTDDVAIHHGVLAEGVAFLHKPFTPRVLLAKVREVLDAR